MVSERSHLTAEVVGSLHVEFTCSSCVCAGQSEHMLNSKLSVGVCEWLYVTLCVYCAFYSCYTCSPEMHIRNGWMFVSSCLFPTKCYKTHQICQAGHNWQIIFWNRGNGSKIGSIVQTWMMALVASIRKPGLSHQDRQFIHSDLWKNIKQWKMSKARGATTRQTTTWWLKVGQ